MSFKLKEALFRVRCREPGCPFYSEFLVKDVITQTGCVVPEILERPVRDAFIKELGNRGLRVTRSFDTQIN